MPSPFPGMDPYLEDAGLWPDVHASLISIAREFLTPSVRPKYYVRIEERVYVSGEDDPGRDLIIPDLRVATRVRRKAGRLVTMGGGQREVTEPEVIPTLVDDEVHESRLEIVQRAGREVVTVIEIVSPTNKLRGSEGRLSYQKKKAEVLRSSAHWMEIDLLRTGEPVVPRLAAPYDYVVHVSRAEQRPQGYVWRIFLQDPLPVVAVPLKPEDGEVPLDLQQVLDTAYDRAGYDLDIDYRRPPRVPLPKDKARWANRTLREKGLR